ncbi:MAG: oligoendopeptidase F [Eubacteriaceae bacterium]|nr:oligoendopeptidase F [Eubacteriaceae bacterium]
MKKLKQRNELDKKYMWDIEDMYSSSSQWEKDLAESETLAKEYASYRGRLTESSGTLLAAFKLKDELWLKLERVYVYAHMKKDEDNRVEASQSMNDKAGAMIAKVSALTSFSTPELLSSDEKTLLGYIDEEPGLEMYRFAIEDLLREKDHVLSHDEENILAQMGEVLPATNEIFTMLNNAEMDFGTVKNEDGEDVQLTHGNYITFMQSHDRNVRKSAYEAMYGAFKKLINTIATAYSYNTKTDVVTARIRKYDSARAAALSGDNIPADVYDNLVDTVNRNLPVLHRYIDIRKKLLGVDELKMHDVYVPLIEMPKKEIPYEQALDIIEEGLAPLGDEYLDRMKKGFASGWVDVYENEGKTSGAYSFGSYDSKPYILLNYTNTLQDVFTVVHEMGHSMHSSYTRESQPFIYGGHSIFTAEVASTVNENLLMKHLIAKEKDPEMKKYLLNMHIEEFRTTLFRQTMFAEFENMTHAAVERGETLTAGRMCEKYNELNAKYFGPSLSEDDMIRYEWARIPHFYNAFYVYKYATGYSAAAAISDIILKDGSKDYIEFLKTGESNYPIDLLKIAGVDMGTAGPVEKAMNAFSDLVEEFERLV